MVGVDGDKATEDQVGALSPVPVRDTLIVPPCALEAILKVPVRAPATEGLKETAIAQDVPWFKEAGQVLV